MSWVSLIPLVLGLLALRRRLRATGWFLVARAGTDFLRSLLAPLREGLPRPYQGSDKVLWLLTDVAPFLVPPAVLIAFMMRRQDGAVFWAMSFLYVAYQYPALRGDGLLLRYYPAVYLTSYIFSWLYLLGRLQDNEPNDRDDMALLYVITMGALSVISVLRNGPDAWWSTWITNGVAYAVVLVLASVRPRV